MCNDSKSLEIIQFVVGTVVISVMNLDVIGDGSVACGVDLAVKELSHSVAVVAIFLVEVPELVVPFLPGRRDAI